MLRMGKQPAKIVEFRVMIDSFKRQTGRIQSLWDCDITQIDPSDVLQITNDVWAIIGSLKVSTSATHIVAGSKALHHVLPNLVPPIDREYTFKFFSGLGSTYIGGESIQGVVPLLHRDRIDV